MRSYVFEAILLFVGIAEFIALVAFVLLLIGAGYLTVRAWRVFYSEQKKNVISQLLDVISVLHSSLKNDLTLSREEMQKLYTELFDVYAALAGVSAAGTQNTNSVSFPTKVDSDKLRDDCRLLCVTTEDIFGKYETLSDADMVTPHELTIMPEQFLYGIVSAPANITLIIRTENDAGQHHEWRITPSDDSAVRRHPFRVMYPHESTGWNTGAYLMQFSLLDDTGVTLDRISVWVSVVEN